MGTFKVGQKVTPQERFGAIWPASARSPRYTKGVIGANEIVEIKSVRRMPGGEVYLKFTKWPFNYDATFFQSVGEPVALPAT